MSSRLDPGPQAALVVRTGVELNYAKGTVNEPIATISTLAVGSRKEARPGLAQRSASTARLRKIKDLVLHPPGGDGGLCRSRP
jgi:hypothetical protein